MRIFFLKANDFGVMLLVTSKLLFVLLMKPERVFQCTLKNEIAKIMRLSLGFTPLLYLPFASSLVFMGIRKIFGTSWLVVIPLTVSPMSISFKVCLSLWDKNLGNWSMIFFLVRSLFGINWSSPLIFSRIMRMLRLYPLKEINSDSSSYRWPCPLILSRSVLHYFSRSLH